MNKAERARLLSVKQLPCIISDEYCGGQVEAHHITDGGRRIDHFHTIPLCFFHHQAQSPVPVGRAVHKGKKLFEKHYGTQMELLHKTNQLLEANHENATRAYRNTGSPAFDSSAEA